MTRLIVHYQPDPEDTRDWNIWGWATEPEAVEGKIFEFEEVGDEFGEVGFVDITGDYDRLGFIIRTDTWEKDGGDRFVDVTSSNVTEVWVKSGDDTVYLSPPDGEYRDVVNHSDIEVKLHYYRYDENYSDWDVWMWTRNLAGQNANGQAVTFEEDEYGVVATLSLSEVEANRIGFIVRQNEWSGTREPGGDRYITRLDATGQAEVWILQDSEKIYYHEPFVDRTPRVLDAMVDDFDEVHLTLNRRVSVSEAVYIQDTSVTEAVYLDIEEIELIDSEDGLESNQLKVSLSEDLDLSKAYTVSLDGFESATLQHGKIVRSEYYDETFYYDGDDLGNTYSASETSFRVWAPSAAEAKLVTYESWDSTSGTEYEMTRDVKGTWTYTLDGDQEGLLYTYKVKIGDEWNEAVDPYARAVAVNGDMGAVVDLASTDPAGFDGHDRPAFSTEQEDAIIYELHVRDLSIHPDSGIENKGKFLGLTETGTTGPDGVKTGLDHIKDLGVTHVQLLPIYDYNSLDEENHEQPQFNWGYDPKNYNAPEGTYSTDPYTPTTRINELKQAVQAMHDNGLRVIMDVVYNHMYSAVDSNFHKLVPGYYYRYDENGNFFNGTGVGNDTASDRKMMSKFIVDSIEYWTTEYKLDGYRFDLMGIHDVDTMNKVRETLDEIDPSIVVLGEGWNMGNHPEEIRSNQGNAEDMPGIAHFNDDMRDAIKGSVFNDDESGFVSGAEGLEDRIRAGIKGGIDNYEFGYETYQDPEQVVTYTEAHDNFTIWDKLSNSNPEATDEEKKKMHKLASSLILTSQGVSFIHAGQEFMRTKYYEGIQVDCDNVCPENSYRSTDEVNRLDWHRRAEFEDEVEYMKGLIELRQAHPALRMRTAEDIREHIHFLDTPEQVVGYTINDYANGDSAKYLAVVFNASNQAVNVTLPISSYWDVLVDGNQAGTEVLTTLKGRQISIPSLSTYVMESDGTIYTRPNTPPPSGGNEQDDEQTEVVKNPTVKDGKIKVSVNKGKSKVVLPANADAVSKGNALSIEGDGFQAEVPADVLKQLLELLPAEERDDASISFTFEQNTDVDELLEMAGEKQQTDLQSVGAVYTFKLSIGGEDEDGTTLSQFGTPIIISIPVEEGADANLTGIYYVGQDGTLEYVGGTMENGMITAEISHFSTYAVLEMRKSYSDVPASHWAADVIAELSAKQIVFGIQPTEFAPNQSVTRAEFTALLARALDLEADGEAEFQDVSADAWYADSVAAAAEAGIVSGVGNGLFAPNATLSREEMAVMLINAYVSLNLTGEEKAMTPFADADEMSDWAVDHVERAARLGLLSGRGENRFAPQAEMTRAESTQVIHTLIHLP
ncbi:type I pullulanase [Marinicrinis sediminis]|uniref:pullulanase n=1 Tax=Marinicrinis sediminis TaxID=1652465 RepID=A0ABW5RGE8_9BACL